MVNDPYRIVLVWDIACPHCGAAAGVPCRMPDGTPWLKPSGAPRWHKARADKVKR